MFKITSSTFRSSIPAAFLWITLVLQVGCSGGRASSEHAFELRAGSTSQLDGWDRTDLVIGGSRVWMSSESVIDDEMIDTVEVTIDHEGRRGLYIRLDPEGTARLERLSVEQLSKPIVVMVDGRPTSAPIVQSPIQSFILAADGLTEEEMEDLARRLRPEAE